MTALGIFSSLLACAAVLIACGSTDDGAGGDATGSTGSATSTASSANGGASQGGASVGGGDQGGATSTTNSGAGGGAPLGGLHGVYVLVNTPSMKGRGDATAAAMIADVDGLAIDLKWSDIAATEPMTYDYTNLDALLTIAANGHKKVQISIVAADGTPSAWFDPSTVMHLQYTAQGGELGTCFDTNSPPPWDTALLAAWDDMTAKLATHLDASFPGLVVAVRVTGLNTHSPETHLPIAKPDPATSPACFTVNNPAVWHKAGYTPTLLKQGWTAMVHSWATNFPTQDMSMALITGKRYPPINDQGMLVATTAAEDNALNDEIVGIAAAAFPGRLVLQREFLISDQAADIQTVTLANEHAVPTSWQTNLWWVNYSKNHPGPPAPQPGAAACGGANITEAVACDPTLFLQLLERGVNPDGLTVPMPQGRTRSIEVFMPDPSVYSAAITQVHGELTQ